MCRHEMAALGGGIDRGTHFGFTEFGLVDIGTVGQYRTGHDHLDPIDAIIQDKVGFRDDFRFTLGDTDTHPRRYFVGIHQATYFTAAARNGDTCTGHEHPRTGNPSFGDGIAQGNIDKSVVAANIAHGGETGLQGFAGVIGTG